MNKINIQEEERHGTPYFPFQAFSQKDTCGQYFAPYHWHEDRHKLLSPFKCAPPGAFKKPACPVANRFMLFLF